MMTKNVWTTFGEKGSEAAKYEQYKWSRKTKNMKLLYRPKDPFFNTISDSLGQEGTFHYEYKDIYKRKFGSSCI